MIKGWNVSVLRGVTCTGRQKSNEVFANNTTLTYLSILCCVLQSGIDYQLCMRHISFLICNYYLVYLGVSFFNILGLLQLKTSQMSLLLCRFCVVDYLRRTGM